jgi:hypothetical protein
MRKIDFAGNILIMLGLTALGAMLVVVMWPLGVGIAALFVASRLISFFNDKKEVVAEKIMQIIANLRPQPVTGELIDSSTATTTTVSQTP